MHIFIHHCHVKSVNVLGFTFAMVYPCIDGIELECCMFVCIKTCAKFRLHFKPFFAFYDDDDETT